MEQEKNNWLKERRKQKEDDRLARAEILAKLERDKRERLEQEQTGMKFSCNI